MLRQQRNDCGFRHQGKAIRGDGTEERRFIAEGEKDGLARACGLLQGRHHGTRSLRELPLGRHFRAKVRERFDRPQKPPDIIFLQRHAEWEQLPEQLESTMRRKAGRDRLLVSLVLKEQDLT